MKNHLSGYRDKKVIKDVRTEHAKIAFLLTAIGRVTRFSEAAEKELARLSDLTPEEIKETFMAAGRRADHYRKWEARYDEAEKIRSNILKHTQPGDYVLIWGNASVYNFLTKRESPSRFVYTYAFGVRNYVSPEMVDGLIADIVRKKPMILDATAGDGNINKIDSKTWKSLPATQSLIRFIEENYVRTDTVGRFRVWIAQRQIAVAALTAM